mgnify:CR=1|tara:strand:- start:171 stop:455 length:285 start_codon:yes stop_codon:yes gene_type:complete
MNTPQTYSDFVELVIGIIDPLIILIITIAFCVFVWGLAKFILAGGSEESVSKGKKLMLWGIIILFIMFSFRAILELFFSDIFSGTFNFPPQLPE